MAINKTVNKSSKSHGAMRNCIEYVLRDEKVRDGLCTVIGPFVADEINYDTVYNAFLDEKRIWDKDSARMYAHNIISFHKDENITAEDAYQFGIDFAEKWFDGFQTLVAVHQDKDHIHIHMVTNSVSYIDGHKLHNSRNDLQRMKDLTNQMCMDRGLTIAVKGHHFDGSLMEQYEISTWSKDKYNLLINDSRKSYLADCALAIDRVLSHGCESREQFISGMQDLGWSVNWSDSRKNITFENEEGKKVRDTNLNKTFNIDVGKEALYGEFERRKIERERKQQLDREYRQQSDEDIRAFISSVDAKEQDIGDSVRASVRDSRHERRNISTAEAESGAYEEQRRLEEQKRAEIERAAKTARRRAHISHGPDLGR
jgi:hypothetical protein